MPNLEKTLPFTTTTPHNYKRRAKSPSFSSILLDAVYRSIDNDYVDSNSPPIIIPHHDFPNNPNYPHDYDHDYPNNPNYHHDYAKQTKTITRSKMKSDGTSTLRRAIMIESWMDKHQHEPRSQPFDHDIDIDYKKIRIVRQKSVPTRSTPSQPSDYNSSSSSTTTTTSSFSSKIRANLAPGASESCFRFDHALLPSKGVQSLRLFTKTKSRAVKLYGDLKKSKPPRPDSQPPVSPGGRIAAFINSIFRHTGGTRSNLSPSAPSVPSTSTCSSASSFSRSCLSKTPSSRGKSFSNSTGTKRSVRFNPVSVIVDEDSRPCGHRSLHRENGDDHLKSSKHANSNVNVDENGKNCRKWRREKEIDALMMMIKRSCHDRTVSSFDCENSDEDPVNDNAGDGGESCASSDLFELENLSCIGVGRYSEELPVYGTTNLENLTAA